MENDYGGTGAGIPIHWQHKDDKPTDIIGETLSAVEDEHGLLVAASASTSTCRKASAHTSCCSVALSIRSASASSPRRPRSCRTVTMGRLPVVRQVKLFEISLVQVAANQGAEVLEVKSGRAISTSDESKLRAALDSLHEVLDGIDSDNKKPDDSSDDCHG